MNTIYRALIIASAALLTIPTSASDIAAPVGLYDKKIEKSEETVPLSEDVTPKRGKKCPIKDDEESCRTMAEAAQNWYCKHNKDGSRPPIPPEMSYIEEHNGYFLGEDEKVIYLTFDAGYENGNVEKILDVLKAEEVPAAFFILENLAVRNTDLVKRMAEEGHTVCNHTAKHKDMTKMTSKDDFASELTAMENIYKEKTGYDMAKFYRPPEGKLNEQNLAWADELGYKTIMWSFAYADWDNGNQMSAEKATAKLLEGTHNGEVLLLHPTSSTNAEILGRLIGEWKSMGYRFGTLCELTKSGDSK